jgi:hypothetical protein
MKTRLARFILAGFFLALIPVTNVAHSGQEWSNPARNGWIKQAPVPTWFNLQGVAVISPNECWIASAPLLGDVGELAHTTDAGRNWTVVSLPRQINAIAFVEQVPEPSEPHGLSQLFGAMRRAAPLIKTSPEDGTFFVGQAKLDQLSWVVIPRLGILGGVASGAGAVVTEPANARAMNAKFDAQIGSRQSLTASYAAARDFSLSTSGMTTQIPSSFLSLHYTGVVTPNMFFTANVSQHTVGQQ